MSRRLTRGLLALLLFAALACAWSYPLVTTLATALPGEFAGDNVSFLWNTWWARQVAGGFPAGFFFSPLLFAPIGFDLTLHTHTALQGAVSAWLLGGIPTVAAQNVIILLTLTLNGLCVYLLARDRTNDTPSALVAGTIFGGSPFVAAHLLGHFNLIHTWVLPAFLLCATRARRHGSPGWSALAGATLVAAAYTDYYLLVYATLLGTGLLLWRTGLVDLRLKPAALSAARHHHPGRPARGCARGGCLDPRDRRIRHDRCGHSHPRHRPRERRDARLAAGPGGRMAACPASDSSAPE